MAGEHRGATALSIYTLFAAVEAKKRDSAYLTAYSQARDYADNQGGQGGNRLMVPDAPRYVIFVRSENDFILHAYMNLTEFRESYFIHHCGGIHEGLWAMTPEWVPG